MSAITRATINFNDNEILVEALSSLSTNPVLVKIIHEGTGDLIYKNTGWDTDNASSPDLRFSTSTSLTVELPEDSNGDIVQGKYLIYYKRIVDSIKLAEWDSFVLYCPTLPTIDIDLEYSCRTSTIVSKDATNYDLVCGCSSGGTIEANQTLLSHVLYYPRTMETPQDPVTDTPAPEIITVTPIFTKRWVSKLSSTVSYEMPEPARSSNILFYIVGQLDGQRYTDVACSDCICVLLSCIAQLYNAYKTAVEKDTKRAIKLQAQLNILNLLLLQFLLSEQCGDEAKTLEICEEIQAYLNYTGLACCDTDTSTEYSVEVVPYGSGSGGSTVAGGTTIHTGDEDPLPGLGNPGDLYIQTTIGYLWKKVTTTWVEQFSLIGEGNVGNLILDSDFTLSTQNGNTYETLKEYTILSADFNDKDRSILEFIGELSVDGTKDADDLSLRVRLNTGSTDTVDIGLDSMPHTIGESFELTINVRYYIKKVSTNQVAVLRRTIVTGATGVLYYENVVKNITLAVSNTLTVSCISNSVTDITLRASYIELKQISGE